MNIRNAAIAANAAPNSATGPRQLSRVGTPRRVVALKGDKDGEQANSAGGQHEQFHGFTPFVFGELGRVSQ